MKRIFLCVVFLALCSTAFAHEINGTITTENNAPIEGVNIYNQNTGGYAYTNVSGYFELDDISEGDIIIISGLGYESQQLTILNSQLDSTLTIVLQESAVSLDQVVLVSKLNVDK